MKHQPVPQASKTTDELKELGLLVGEWKMLGTHPAFPSAANGHSSFAWLQPGMLLIWHFDWEQPGPPSAISVIGYDDAAEAYSMLYSDERGVARIYQINFDGGVWRMHRESPGFSQRATGTFSNDGRVITVHGELSRDGSTWEQDLDIVYTKIG